MTHTRMQNSISLSYLLYSSEAGFTWWCPGKNILEEESSLNNNINVAISSSTVLTNPQFWICLIYDTQFLHYFVYFIVARRCFQRRYGHLRKGHTCHDTLISTQMFFYPGLHSTSDLRLEIISLNINQFLRANTSINTANLMHREVMLTA